MQLTGIRQKVFLDRYSLKDQKGNPTEQTPEEMWRRVSAYVASIEKGEKNKKYWEEQFLEVMQDFQYVPGGRILSGAGTGFKVTFYNCFVIPSPKDSRGGILNALGQMVEIMARGGGVGINISSLRPRGTRVKTVNGFASGPCNWAELFSVATKDIIQQGGTRRGALMLMLWDWHPDIEEFITVKRDLARINGANLSVCVSDSFMEAVEQDADWPLIFPDVADPKYNEQWDGDMEMWKKNGGAVKTAKLIKARTLWNLIAEAAWASAEPGVVFMERYNKMHNNWYWNRINCVNPCVTGDTLVATTNGMYPIKQLYIKGLPFRVVVNGKDYLSTKVKMTGVKPVYRLITKEGYEIRLTHDHKVFTTNGKKEAGKFVKGEKILLSTGGYFGLSGTLSEGNVLGWLVGDGALKKEAATLYFYREEKKELAPQFAQMVQKMVTGEEVTTRTYSIAPQYIDQEDKAVIESVRLWRIAARYGLTPTNKLHVPDAVFSGSQAFQKGFLQGLFSSDGCVLGTIEKGASVRLTSISYLLLQQVQRLLLNFSIVSTIYRNRRDAGARFLPDGRGRKKLYDCQAYHELVITKQSLIRFAALIGFLHKAKQNKLQDLLSLYQRGPYKETFMATFDRLEEDGSEEVFDITVADVHRFSANGLIVSNCGEEGLPPWGVCNLGSINLSALVKNAEDPDMPGEFDFDRLHKLVKIAVRFQDNIVDLDPYVFDGIKKMQHEGERRIGLGTMGLGDALIKMHLRYGDDNALEFIDKIYKIIRDEAYRASIENAKEKGIFSKFDAKLFSKGKFIQQLPLDIQRDIKKFGIRNSVLLMQAPTGTTSLLSNTTSGIEPVYEFEFIRRDRLGVHTLRHHLFEEWYQKHKEEVDKGLMKRPSWFVSANDLSPEDHVRVQGVIQQYVDASISKTVNAPATHTVDDVKRLYTLAYKLGLKGIAYMREGSRPGVYDRETKTDKKEEVKPIENKIPEVKPRPMMVKGATYQVQTPVGKAYITVNTNGNNEPLEVFINVGKAGTDVTAMAEGLGRMVSLMLRFNSHLTSRERAVRIIDELSGIGGSKSYGFGKDRVRSLPDALAKVLATHLTAVAIPSLQPIIDAHQSNGSLNGSSVIASNGAVERVLSQTEDQQTIEMPSQAAQLTLRTHQSYDLCPDCGVLALAYEEGCKKCYSCGYSEC